MNWAQIVDSDRFDLLCSPQGLSLSVKTPWCIHVNVTFLKLYSHATGSRGHLNQFLANIHIAIMVYPISATIKILMLSLPVEQNFSDI